MRHRQASSEREAPSSHLRKRNTTRLAATCPEQAGDGPALGTEEIRAITEVTGLALTKLLGDANEQKGDSMETVIEKWIREERQEAADEERKRAEKEKNRADKEKNRADTEKNRADKEKNRADKEKNRADTEKNRADKEKNRADTEKNRADALEKETLDRARRQTLELHSMGIGADLIARIIELDAGTVQKWLPAQGAQRVTP